MKRELQFCVNRQEITLAVDPAMRLLDLLRQELLLTGTKEGCGIGECGGCTVLLDGKAVNACLVLAGQAAGHDILTIEGLEKDGELDRLQQIFFAHTAIQCGFCTPGMILSAKALLLANPAPTVEEIKTALAGNICRCAGYTQIINAVQAASEELRGEADV